ncbi:g11311 [Coccomyxa viridis]|uniref:G11311 protein n=1 Tax=Coccomyxa viridis TaxID=1274662 RepID=A0ABP1GBS7_9CHLO
MPGKLELPIELLVALAPDLVVADLLKPWSGGQAAPLGPWQGYLSGPCWSRSSSITRRLCSESLHHLRVSLPLGFDPQVVAAGLPNVLTLHFECQEPLGACSYEGARTLDISCNTACRQLCLGNILPGALIVPDGCRVYVDNALDNIVAFVGRLKGTHECVVGLNLHVGGWVDIETVFGHLTRVCAALPGVESLLLHIDASFEYAESGSAHIDLQAVAAL